MASRSPGRRCARTRSPPRPPRTPRSSRTQVVRAGGGAEAVVRDGPVEDLLPEGTAGDVGEGHPTSTRDELHLQAPGGRARAHVEDEAYTDNLTVVKATYGFKRPDICTTLVSGLEEGARLFWFKIFALSSQLRDPSFLTKPFKKKWSVGKDTASASGNLTDEQLDAECIERCSVSVSDSKEI